MVAPYRAKAALLAAGTPSRSVITAIGNGDANPDTRSNAPSLGSAASALGGLTRNYFPEANAIPELMRDANNLWGGASYYNENDLYYASRVMNKWGDRWAEEMERRMGVTSNAKAMAEARTGVRPPPIGQDDLVRRIAEVQRGDTRQTHQSPS